MTLRRAAAAVIPPRGRAYARRLATRLDRQMSIRTIGSGSSVVLGYHGVARADFDPWGLFLPPELFVEHLEAIARHFRPVSLCELVAAATGGTPLHKAVAVTFDDGYRNLLDEAKPLLERFGIPATAFVVSGYVDSGSDFWWDALTTIAFSPHRPIAGSAQLDGLDVDWSLLAEDLYFSLYEQVQSFSHARRSVLLGELTTLSKSGAVRPQTMTTDELLDLTDGELVTVGSHSVTHPRLPELDRSSQLDEMRTSRRDLEKKLGRPVRSFAFPHGAVTADGLACAQEAGYTLVCTSAQAAVRAQPEPERRGIPRCFVYDKWHGDEFAWQLSRLFRLGAAPDL